MSGLARAFLAFFKSTTGMPSGPAAEPGLSSFIAWIMVFSVKLKSVRDCCMLSAGGRLKKVIGSLIILVQSGKLKTELYWLARMSHIACGSVCRLPSVDISGLIFDLVLENLLAYSKKYFGLVLMVETALTSSWRRWSS